METLNTSIGEEDVNTANLLFALSRSRSQCRQSALVELDSQPAATVGPDQPSS